MAVVEALVQHGADAHKLGGRGAFVTPLHVAAERGHAAIVRFLADHCECDIMQGDEEGLCPLHVAAENGHLDVVNALLDLGCQIDHPSSDGRTALACAARGGHVEVVEALITAGCKLDEADNCGFTALFHAAQEGNVPVVRQLIDADCDIDARDNDNSTPLIVAAHAGHLDVVQFLSRSGCDLQVVNSDGFTALLIACREGHNAVALYLAVQSYDHNATKLAIAHGHDELAQSLADLYLRKHRPNAVSRNSVSKIVPIRGLSEIGVKGKTGGALTSRDLPALQTHHKAKGDLTLQGILSPRITAMAVKPVSSRPNPLKLNSSDSKPKFGTAGNVGRTRGNKSEPVTLTRSFSSTQPFDTGKLKMTPVKTGLPEPNFGKSKSRPRASVAQSKAPNHNQSSNQTGGGVTPRAMTSSSSVMSLLGKKRTVRPGGFDGNSSAPSILESANEPPVTGSDPPTPSGSSNAISDRKTASRPTSLQRRSTPSGPAALIQQQQQQHTFSRQMTASAAQPSLSSQARSQRSAPQSPRTKSLSLASHRNIPPQSPRTPTSALPPKVPSSSSRANLNQPSNPAGTSARPPVSSQGAMIGLQLRQTIDRNKDTSSNKSVARSTQSPRQPMSPRLSTFTPRSALRVTGKTLSNGSGGSGGGETSKHSVVGVRHQVGSRTDLKLDSAKRDPVAKAPEMQRRRTSEIALATSTTTGVGAAASDFTDPDEFFAQLNRVRAESLFKLK
eukprot:c16864_g2_i1.p1 GENE.c16864_g2_i1~~c16864_g2_i1.p1  ORF type:complete len:792 (+),score=141.22 c16864_g2_i1:189-2378(+)